jgi:probable rRNA maturation factor
VSVAVDISISCKSWRRALPRAGALARRAVAAALREARHSGDAELSLVLADDATLAALNAKYRRRAGPTNVLSFPASPPLLGDVVIAYQTVAREARAQNKRLGDHFAHLVVHGTLHLLGHDHVKRTEAARMERLEVAALFRLGIADPYNEGAR